MVGVGAAEVDVEDVEVVEDPTEAEEVPVVEVPVRVEELFKVVSVEVDDEAMLLGRIAFLVYKDRRLPAPQNSVALPAQVMPQSVSGLIALVPANVLPQ
jgi:hypothetical protein